MFAVNSYDELEDCHEIIESTEKKGVRGATSGCQKSWRKAAFSNTVTYGTFLKRRGTTFQNVPQIREHLKRHNGS
jgi:hypothetical protein